jgi:two-component system chemotaxis response regulator CheY
MNNRGNEATPDLRKLKMELKDLNVLIVDDVKSIRTQLKELLFIIGFRNFNLFENIAEVKTHLLGWNETHLILSDWHMEGGTGLQLLKWVRERERLREIPFILVTAEQTKEAVMEAISSGVDNYLVKPLTAAQVHTKVFNTLKKKKVEFNEPV